MKIGRKVIPNALIFFVAMAVAGGAYLATKEEGKPNPAPSSVEAQTTSREATTPGGSANASPGETTSTQPTPEPARSSLTPSITTLDQDAGSVYLSVLVNGATTGTCTATFEKAGYKAVTQTAPVGRVTSYYACQGFTFAKSTLPAKGEWTVSAKVTAPGGEGTARSSLVVN